LGPYGEAATLGACEDMTRKTEVGTGAVNEAGAGLSAGPHEVVRVEA
jgi:hypothetical protein